jgi:hypothetical protein
MPPNSHLLKKRQLDSNTKLTITRSNLWPKALLMIGLTLLLCCEGYFGYRLHEVSAQQEEVKEDYANINNITFGLFSVDQWRDKVKGIINHQVKGFTMTKKQKRALQIEVEQILLALINKAESLLNKPQKGLGGKLKKLAINTFVNADKIKAQVPGFAQNIIKKVDNPANKKQLNKMALKEFEAIQHTEFIDSALKATQAATQKVYKKYKVSSTEQFNAKALNALADMRSTTYRYSFGMLACIVVVLSLWWILRKKTHLHTILFILSLIFAFMLLAVGLTASMIEVDARISKLDFVLLGEHVVFNDQVLFFQSKSIIDVVVVLISQSGIDSILVGVLILVFSVLFPIMKLSSTGIHLLGRKSLAENGVVKYFAFQSGKWSMADVIVIAILMTYIGLNGLLEEQLKGLNITSDSLTLITTNNTALQPGYIIFISFVLYGLILSTILKFISPHDSH